jgi:BirA family biotin operon repressor/biotin-[acetyl-CoA-carboxylase] ligase
MSVVLPPVGAAPWLPLVVGLAVAEAVEEATGVLAVGLKWPNDLVLRGRKLGGILCESAGGAVVAGVGVNLRAPREGFPGRLSQSATSLDVEGAKSLAINRLVGSILNRLEVRLEVSGAELEDATLAELAARDVLADRAVHTEELGRGTARGIARSGSLVLERPDGYRVTVSSGSVRLV